MDTNTDSVESVSPVTFASVELPSSDEFGLSESGSVGDITLEELLSSSLLVDDMILEVRRVTALLLVVR